jgi:hypothetical protein
MREFRVLRSRGQAAILVALVAVAVIAFVALAVDGGQAYSLRRQSQNAADGAAIAGTYVMVEYSGASPVADILRNVNTYAEANGVRDTNGGPGDPINDNVLAYYVDYDGNRLQLGGVDWELHAGPDIIPGNARGIEAVVAMSNTTFFARVIGQTEVRAGAFATAVYQPDGGILPIAVNEYWAGHNNKCPYTNCEEPYSFVRDPGEPPPFELLSGDPGDDTDVWGRIYCADPYNENTCQGPYEGYGENFGLGFALLGADAKPNYGSMDPRSFVHLDWRYNAIIDGQDGWYYLVTNDTFMGPIKPAGNKQEMSEVIKSGGYSKTPIPRALHEPPPARLQDWGYCWDTPGADNCFNYPDANRTAPFDVLEFLSGADASKEAKSMYDDGNYIDGRFAPGERIVILVYNGASADTWGVPGSQDDAALIMGYFGAVILEYGNKYATNCNCAPFDFDCLQTCVDVGNPNTVYGMVGPGADLTIDPSKLLEEFLPKEITLIK